MSTAPQTADVSLADRVTRMVESGEVQLPPLPELAIRLQKLLADENRADAAAVAELIQNEPAVVTELLHIANSAAYGGLQEVTSLRTAIARLGLKEVGSIVTALLVKGHFQAKRGRKSELQKTIWDHSVMTAFGARILAGRVSADAEEAFLAGLLHDCGQLLVLKAVDQLERDQQIEPLSDGALLELMRTLHCKLGHQALEQWNLPAPIPQTALRHEESAERVDDLLLICVQAAIVITQKLGFHLDPDEELPLLQEPAIENLALKDVELATLMVDIEDELLELQKLF